MNATTPSVGKKCGAFHQAAESGRTVAFHTRIEVLRTGSPVSDAMSVRASRTSGQVTATAMIVYARNAPTPAALL